MAKIRQITEATWMEFEKFRGSDSEEKALSKLLGRNLPQVTIKGSQKLEKQLEETFAANADLEKRIADLQVDREIFETDFTLLKEQYALAEEQSEIYREERDIVQTNLDTANQNIVIFTAKITEQEVALKQCERDLRKAKKQMAKLIEE